MRTNLSILGLLLCAPLVSGCTSSPQQSEQSSIGGKGDSVRGCCTSSDCDGPDGDGDEDDGVCPMPLARNSIAAGFGTSLILRSDGHVMALGHNAFGSLGDGTTTERHTAIQNLAAPAVSVTACAQSAAAISANGALQSWGDNMWGELGTGWNDKFSSIPRSVTGRFVAVAAGCDFTLALLPDGTLSGWGDNDVGELGEGPRSQRNIPGPVPGITNARAIAANTGHGLALLGDGTVVQLGYWLGQQGTATAPTRVPGLSGVVGIASGSDYFLAVLANGTVMAWGANTYGQLGDGTSTDRQGPVQVLLPPGASAVRVAAGDSYSLALLADGSVVAWGHNVSGQLGIGNKLDQNVPQPVVGLANVTELAAGLSHSLARRSDGTVLVWGSNDSGQLGIGRDSLVPVELGRF